MRRLTESLLELHALTPARTMKRLHFDLANTVRDCVELIRPLADERGVTIHCDLRPTECEGDPERLAQVITNLQPTPFITTRIAAKSAWLRSTTTAQLVLMITDTGNGLPATICPCVRTFFARIRHALFRPVTLASAGDFQGHR
jgi:nitrogen fixation/metabolism regulation signal transduction histidine kinase